MGGKQDFSAYSDKCFKMLVKLVKLQPYSEAAGKKYALTSVHVLTTRPTQPRKDLSVSSHFLQ